MENGPDMITEEIHPRLTVSPAWSCENK